MYIKFIKNLYFLSILELVKNNKSILNESMGFVQNALLSLSEYAIVKTDLQRKTQLIRSGGYEYGRIKTAAPFGKRVL